MENKKLGILIIILSIFFLVFAYSFNSTLSKQSRNNGCELNERCMEIESGITLTHLAFGFFGFMFSLGFYILYFYKTEERILNRLEEDKNIKINDEKFKYILMGLDDYGKKVLKAVKEQDGITQSTLRLRTDMSKAKLSYVLQELEKRNLIKRNKKGKTLEIFLKV